MNNFLDDDTIKALNAAYWAEEDELKMGIHTSQVKERIEEVLHESDYSYKEITFLDWKFQGPRVGVSIDDKFYGVFDYEENRFESTPQTRLQEFLEAQELGTSAHLSPYDFYKGIGKLRL